MVEQRSPKPRAEGSSPSAPAKDIGIAFAMPISFCMSRSFPRHARAGQRARPRPVDDRGRAGWRSGRQMCHAPSEHICREPQEGCEALQVLLPLPKNSTCKNKSNFFIHCEAGGISSAVRLYIIKGGKPPLYLITSLGVY